MGAALSRFVVLDAGALIAVERAKRRMTALLEVAFEAKLELVIPAGVLAQTWRNGARQARLSRLVAAQEVEVAVLDREKAKAVGTLCGLRSTHDTVDAQVVLEAKRLGAAVVTSDPDDLRHLDPTLALIEI